MAFGYKIADNFATLWRDLIIWHAQNVQALSFFILECLNNNLNSFVSDVISTQVQFFDGFTQTQTIFESFNSLKTYFVLFQTKNFKVLFIFQGLTKGDSSFSEYSIIAQSQFCDVLLVQKNFAYGLRSTWTNEVLGQKQLS
mgnify:CR=1 FL=1